MARVVVNQRENILKTAKALVEDTKVLVAGAASNQEQLAAAAQAAVKTITRLADVVKVGAGALGCEQNEAQVSELCLSTGQHSPCTLTSHLELLACACTVCDFK